MGWKVAGGKKVMKYTYYRPNKQVIGLHVTKKSFKDAVKLISGRLDVSEPPEINYDKYTITFKQDRLFDTSEQTAQLGDWVTSENAEARVYTNRDFNDRFTEIFGISSWYTPTRDEVKVIEKLGTNDEYCYGYDYICEDGMSRDDAKKAIDNLRSMGVVKFYRGLMNDDGEVCGSGFNVSDRVRAEALLYRYHFDNRDYDTLLASGAYSTAATMVATARQVIAEHPERADSELAQLESALRAQSVDKNKA